MSPEEMATRIRALEEQVWALTELALRAEKDEPEEQDGVSLQAWHLACVARLKEKRR